MAKRFGGGPEQRVELCEWMIDEIENAIVMSDPGDFSSIGFLRDRLAETEKAVNAPTQTPLPDWMMDHVCQEEWIDSNGDAVCEY